MQSKYFSLLFNFNVLFINFILIKSFSKQENKFFNIFFEVSFCNIKYFFSSIEFKNVFNIYILIDKTPNIIESEYINLN